MAMPTTRRGRYEHYRAKALRRKKAYGGRRFSDSALGKRKTARGRDLTEWGKQEPKLYPRFIQRPRPDGFFATNDGDVKPEKGVLGVRVQLPQYVVPPWLNSHNREGRVLYQLRRVKSLPPSRSMPFRPYRYSLDELEREDFYPFEKYPSGQPSYSFVNLPPLP